MKTSTRRAPTFFRNPSSNRIGLWASNLRISKLQWALIAFFAALAMPTPILAQVTGTIQGQVTDSSGAIVLKATVTASNEATGVSRKALSADDGYYRITDLLAGNYEVRVEFPGFKTGVYKDVLVNGASTVGLNLVLEPGELIQTVEVSADSLGQVETQSARISEILPEREIRELPVQGRGILNMVMLSPGIVGKQQQSGDYCCDVFSNFAAPSISTGAKETKSSFSVDGIDMRYSEGSGWGAAFSPNPDAIEEVRVTTDPHSAEYGRSSGPTVQIVTKGGTNSLHGTAHILFADSTLNARPFFSSQTPQTSYKLFGATVGGPIKKDRLFFFASYEGLRSTASATSLQIAETQAFRDSVVNTRPNSIAAKLLQGFPPVKYPTQGLVDEGRLLPGGGYSSQPDGIPDVGLVSVDAPFQRDGNQFNGRADFIHPNQKDRFFGTYWFSRPQWGQSTLRPVLDGTTFTRVQSAIFTETHAFTPTSLNEARFGATYIDFNMGAPLYRFPNIPTITGDDGFSLGLAQNQWQIYSAKVYYGEDIFSTSHGKNNFKFGFSYRHSHLDSDFPTPPYYTFDNILAFASDQPYQETRQIDAAGNTRASGLEVMLAGDLAIFNQNTWQIRSNLTLNYGLRWEYFFRISSGNLKSSEPGLTEAQITPAGIGAAVNTPVAKLYKPDLHNFGPRIGLAWDPTKRGKMSVHLAMGILYDEIDTFPLNGLGSQNGIDLNPPSFASVSAGRNFGTPVTYGLAPEGTTNFPQNPALVAPTLTPQGGFLGRRVNLAGIVSDLQNPRTLNTTAGVQYQLTGDTMVQVNYTYRRSTNSFLRNDFNRFAGDMLDGHLDRLNPYFGTIAMITNLGRLIGQNVIVNVTRRLNHGLSLSASYTYANYRDNYESPGSYIYASGDTDAFNLNSDWARDDIPRTLTVHSLFEFPFLRGRKDLVGRIFGGWQANTVWNLQAGGIFTPVSSAAYGKGGDFNADGQSSERPDAPTQNLAQSFSKSQWLKGILPPSIFPLPPVSSPRIGTLRRDYFRLPGYINVDLALQKEFAAWRESKVQIRGEFFNLPNHMNIQTVGARINTPATFGTATAAYPNRTVQISLKYVY